MKIVIGIVGLALLAGPTIGGQEAPPDPLLQWMNGIAQRYLDARDREMAAIHSIADMEKRKTLVLRKILDSLGGLPEYNGPLNAHVTGQIQAEGYVIEKVI